MKCLNKSLPLIQEALSLIPSEPAVAKIIASLPSDATIDDVLARYNEMQEEKQAFKYNNTFFQTKTGQEFSDEMKARLLKFLQGLDITVEFDADEILNSREFNRNPLAAFDVLQKFMAFASGQESLLPREVAAAAYTFLGRKTTLHKALWHNIKLWQDYDKWYNAYNKVNDPDLDTFYEDEEFMDQPKFNPFAHKMAIIRFLEESMMRVASGARPTEKAMNEDVDVEYFAKRGRLNERVGSELERAFKRFYNYLLDLFGQPIFKKYDSLSLTNLGLDIAEDVLKADFYKFIRTIKEKDGKLFNNKGELLELKTYNDTLKNDPVATNLLKRLINNPYIGFKLSGSLTLRRYGTLFRDVKEDLHDIDGVIPLDVFMKDPQYKSFMKWLNETGVRLMQEGRQKEFQKQLTPRLLQLNWYQNLMQEFPQFDLTKTFIGRDHKRGESITIQGEIKIGESTYKMDFFLRTREGNYPEIFDNYWKDWKQIFEAKLNMGRGKDISDLVYFSPFIQDKYKFTNKGFRYFVFAENNVQAQLEDLPATEANAETVAKVKEVIAKMGGEIQDLATYAREKGMSIKGVNGVADLTRRIIAVAEGREGVVLTEEMVHMATAIMEQVNPSLVTEMISRIDKFKIYKRVLDVYRDDPRYQLPNGKPDIRKIKKEAVDKLIAEVIVRQSEGSNMYPELLEPESKGLIRSWWDKILKFFKIKYESTGIDIYEKAAASIMAGEMGQAGEIQLSGVYLNLTKPQEDFFRLASQTKDHLTKVYEKQETDSVLVDSEEANNFYEKTEASGARKKVSKRVTDRVKAWYRKVFKEKTFSEFEQKINEAKRTFGIQGHADLEGIIKRYYNEDGTRKAVPDAVPDEINLPSMEMYSKLEKYFLDFIDMLNERHTEGQVAVYTEVLVYDPVEDEAGTIDVVIVEPDGVGNVLDWKFMQVKADKDVPWFKQGAYNTQLGRYKGMLTDYYGIKQFNKVRAIPILMDVERINKKDPDSDFYLSKVTIGSVNPAMLEDLRLVPVSEETEETGFKEIDNIIKSLNALLEQAEKEEVLTEEDFEYKVERMNLIRRAIRYLQGTQNIEPLVKTVSSSAEEGVSILARLEQFIQIPANAEDVDNQMLSDLAADARNFIDVAGLFQDIDAILGPLIYNEEMEQEATTDEEKEDVAYRKNLVTSLSIATARSREYRRKVQEASRKFADIHMGERNAVKGLESPEAILKGLANDFRGAGELDAASIKILVRLVEEAQVKAEAEALEVVRKVMALKESIEKKHGDPGEYIKKIFQYTENGDFMNKLIYQYQREFHTTVDKLKDGDPAQNRAWLDENIDMEAYRAEAMEALNKRLTRIENNPLYQITQEDEDERLDEEFRRKEIFAKEEAKKKAINDVRALYDIDYEGFTGWNNYIIKRHPLSKWYSKQYKELVENPRNAEALEMYKMLREINKEARDVGYITAVVEKVFFPYVRKMRGEDLKLDSGLSAFKRFFQSFQARADDIGFGAINEVTGEFENALPRYYTYDFTETEQGVNDYSDVSQEVYKNAILYIGAVKRYKYMSEIEDQLLLVKAVEEFKTNYQTNKLGDVVFENNKPNERKEKENNSRMFNVLLKAIFYGQKYASTLDDEAIPVQEAVNFVKSTIAAVRGKEVKEEEVNTYTSLNKTIQNANLLTSLKFLGLSVFSGAVNLFGVNLQLMAQKSDYFNYREIMANALRLRKHLYSEGKSDKVFFELMETFMPLNEDPNYKYYKDAGLSWKTRRKLSDDLMVFMRKPEILMEKAVFKTLLDNTMVENGKLVNIRQFVTNKYKTQMFSEPGGVKKYKDIIEKEIEALRPRSINNIAKIDKDGKLVVEGLDLNNKKELKRLTLLSRRIASRAAAKASPTNVSRASTNIWLSFVMLFKNFVAPLTFTRFNTLRLLNDDFNVAIDDDGKLVGERYDIGNVRLYLYVLSTSIKERSTNIVNILRGNEKGLQSLDELYQTYSKDYKKATGKTLNMTPEDFKHMVVTKLQRQTYELRILLGLFLTLMASGFFAPDDDEDRATKNRFRFMQKVIRKFYDEVSFFYRPSEFLGVLSGGAPAVSLITDFSTLLDHMTMQFTGLDISKPELSAEKVREKAQPIKYLIKFVPGGRSLIEWAASFSEDFAKEFDVTIPNTSRR